MRRYVFVVIIILISSNVFSQSVEIATWRNNATAAYSIVSDDYNLHFFGDLDYIHTTTSERNVSISFAVVADWNNQWGEARDFLLGDGHEFTTHSMNHAHNEENTPEILEWQLLKSQEIIEEEIPGAECVFMCNWGNMNKEGVLDFLKVHRFIGARGFGRYGGIHTADFDPFLLNTVFYQDGLEAEIKAVVDNVIANGGYGLNSVHYIGGPISWGYIDKTPWISHLDYIQSKRDSNELWIETVQRVIKYRMEREFYTVNIEEESLTNMEISFSTSVEINSSPKVDNSIYNEDLTLIVTTSTGLSQLIDANPFNGNVTVTYDDEHITSATQGGEIIYRNPLLSAKSEAYNIASDHNFVLYPNPASNHLNIRCDGIVIESYRLIDLSGKVVLEQENLLASAFEINISNFEKGTYVLRAETDKAEILSGKIIIQP